MKIKYVILLLLMVLLCGCTKIEDKSIDSLLDELNTPCKTTNTYHTGFKYYVPNDAVVSEYMLYNDVITTKDYTFYLYADIISYYNKAENTYEENPNAYFSKKFDYNKKSGYIEIILKDNNQYLIEIMYNYAKIEVMVDSEDNINLAISYAADILGSVKYDDVVINNLLGEDVLTFQEEEYDIFSNVKSESSSYLKYSQAEDIDEESDKKKYKDTDLLN